jgi:formylglycine-generating enzyme required for sulfatase activity
MKWMQTWRWLPAAVLLAIGGTTAGLAEDLAIQSFDGTGHSAGRGDSYLVVDLSGGTSAVNYAVTYLDSVPPGGWTDAYKTTNILMRLIPKGTFTMGSPSNELGREPWDLGSETQRQVTLTQDFYLGVFEVTQRQWELVMGNKPSYFNNATYYQTRPVEQVSYCDIRENPEASRPNWPATNTVHVDSFMGKLRSKTGLSGFDLPTESQWEYACRAGTTTALNSGHNLTDPEDNDPQMNVVGRYNYNGGSSDNQGCAPSAGTAAAGSYSANAWGLYDMHGNVWEWCLDWYATNPEGVTDPPGASSGSDRVLRDGSWSRYARDCRSASRSGAPPYYKSHYGGGFRVCCAPPKASQGRSLARGDRSGGPPRDAGVSGAKGRTGADAPD